MKYLVLFVILGIFSFIAGYTLGQAQAITFCVEIGAKFLELQGVEIDKQMIKEALTLYRSQLGNIWASSTR